MMLKWFPLVMEGIKVSKTNAVDTPSRFSVFQSGRSGMEAVEALTSQAQQGSAGRCSQSDEAVH